MLSASMAPRSTLEAMLEALKGQDDKPKDIPPALPSRPTSKARLPSNVRLRRSVSPSMARISQLSGQQGGDTEIVVESSRASEESDGVKSSEAKVSADSESFLVQVPRTRLQEKRAVTNGGEKENIAEKSYNGLEDNGIKVGANSFMQDSELSNIQYYANLDSPYEEIEYNYESNGREFCSSVAVEPGHVKRRKVANSFGLTENSLVWCMVLHKQWTSGIIRSISGTEAVVKTYNNDVVKVPLSDLFPANPQILEGVSDLIQLSYLNEPSVLHNLQQRYDQGVIYTKAGPVLVAINPFKRLSLSDNEVIKANRCRVRDIPHVYLVTDTAFDSMIRDGMDQSIIVSGESGAGKTETAKIAMQHLSLLGGSSSIGNRLLQTNALLESLGNAKTLGNDNASRFGKLISIHFNESGKICGATIQTYFLEKARVVQQDQGERSYHIFYQLCAGASSGLRDRLNLKLAREYYYLNQSNCLTIDEVDDARKFQLVLEALNAIQISQEDQENAFRIMAAVLWLGNITFSVDTECHVTVDNNEAIRNASKLLGCSMIELMEALSIRKVYSSTECVIQKLSQAQAADIRDSLAKAIYGSLFNWLTDCINSSLTAQESSKCRSINIIDMYGFASFNSNSFEQLCINYANERLQQHFNHHFFKLEQEDYSLEGIDWTKVEFEDNQECLDLIEKKPLGLFSLLDKESESPEGSDSTLFDRLKKQLSGKACFKGERGRVFSIRHYAGEVVYHTAGLLEKNRNSVHSYMLQLLSSSNCELMRLFSSNIKEDCRYMSPPYMVNGTNRKVLSVATKLKGQLFKLLQHVQNTSQHFICCIKPNRLQRPGVFEPEIVLQQLHCYGVLGVVRMSRIGYPSQITHEQFTKRYGFLLSQNIRGTDPLSACVAILQHVNIRPEMYQVGFTKLFLRAGQISSLEALRTRTLQRIRLVQNVFRGHAARCHFKQLKSVAIFLQALVRSNRVRKEYLVLKERHQAAVTIQKELRCRITRQKYTRTLNMVILLQSVTRGWLARRLAHKIQHQLLPEMVIRNPGSRNEISPECRQSSEDAFQHASTIKFQPVFPAEFQNRLLAADAALREKEDENAVLRQQLQQYETRWQEYESKMASMEETWQKQISSLQMSLVAAKKNRAGDELIFQQTKLDEYTKLRPNGYQASATRQTPPHDNNEFDWEGATSMGTKTPISGKVSRHSDCGQSKENGSAVGHLMKEFEYRTQVFNDDANFLVEVKSGQAEANLNPDEELQKLKKRFKAWKKAFKVRLRDTKNMLHKLGNTEASEKARRKWWGKRSN